MLWFVVWAVLVIVAVVVLGRLAWSVFRKGVAVAAELGEASARLAAISAQVERLTEQWQPQEPAIFDDPARLRRERDRREREARRRRRRAARRRATAA